MEKLYKVWRIEGSRMNLLCIWARSLRSGRNGCLYTLRSPLALCDAFWARLTQQRQQRRDAPSDRKFSVYNSCNRAKVATGISTVSLKVPAYCVTVRHPQGSHWAHWFSPARRVVHQVILSLLHAKNRKDHVGSSNPPYQPGMR